MTVSPLLRSSLAALLVFAIAGCAQFGGTSTPGANGLAASTAATTPAAKVKRKKTPEQRNARFEAIGERYRLAHASDDGSIPVDGLVIAARERAALVENAKRSGTAKLAGIGRSKWTDLGPDKIGGRGRALLIDPTNPSRMWFGAATGGIWASTDAGASWSPVNDYLPNLAISHMVMDATNPDVMYAASGEPFASGVSGNGAFRGVGIFKSSDRGLTWNLLEATRPADETSPWLYVNRLAISPTNGNHLLAATRSGGLFESTNGGTSWTRKTLPSESAACGGFVCSMTDVLFHPANAQQIVVAAGAAMFASADGGQTFTFHPLADAASARTPDRMVRVSLAAAQSVPGRFVASVNHAETDPGNAANTDRGQVWLTTDGGATWTWLATPRHLGGQGDYDNTIWVDPTNPNVIVAAGIDVWRTTDGTAPAPSFVKVSDWAGPREFQAHADHHLIVHHPGYNGTTNRIVYVTNDGGVQRANDILAVNVAFDATSGWTRLNTSLKVTQFYTIVARLVNGRLQVLGGTQDNGNPLLRPTGTSDWEDITGGDGAGVGIDSRNPNRMYTAYIHSTPQTGVDGITRQTSICTPAQMPGGCADNTGNVPGGTASNFIAPMILDPNDSDRLFTGTNDVLLTKNPTADSPTWEIIKAGFPREDQNYVASIEVARGNSDVIMVGHNQGQIFRTARGTQADVLNSWTQVSTAAMPKRYNTAISIDPRNASRAWVTFGGFERSNVWFTANGGQSWTNIHNNLPMQPVYRVLPHPTRDNWLYAATETGVYTSEDGGATWSATDDGPAYVVVHDMTFASDTTLVVGTHGRGAWRIDAIDLPAGALIPSVASLDFGGQSMNTTAPARSLTLTNGGASAVTVTAVTASTNFAASSDCASLAAGASCTVSVTFTPTTQGSLTGTITVANSLGTQTIALLGTGERSLTTHYYRSILRRAPDSGGKAYWDSEATRVQALGVNVNEVWYAMAGSFFGSTEYAALARSDEGFVTDLYNTFFNRAPDAGGFADWKAQLVAGMPREVVLASFMFSGEFASFTQAVFGTTITRKEVDTVVDFYRGLLGSLPDDGGFNYWLGLFRTAQCQGGAAVNAQVETISSAFANSAQYANRGRSNAQYVGDLYNAFLRRGAPGDNAGVQFWINQIATGARSRENVRQAFVASGEFQTRVAAIIAQGCNQ